MKIHNGKLFLVALLAIGLFVWKAIAFEDPVQDFVSLCLLGYFALYALYIALFQEAYEEESAKEARKTQAARRAFGKGLRLAQAAPFLILVVGCVILALLPLRWVNWGAVGLLTALVVCLCWYVSRINRALEQDETE